MGVSERAKARILTSWPFRMLAAPYRAGEQISYRLAWDDGVASGAIRLVISAQDGMEYDFEIVDTGVAVPSICQPTEVGRGSGSVATPATSP